jgi:hypothetical protein
MAEFIDLTPDALKTPEGAERANKAADELSEAVSGVAHAFNEIWSDHSLTAKGIRQHMEPAMQRWRDAGEELARAVAGRPPVVR